MRVYLTGFMGSGKSTVGPLVARRLGVPFVDLDDAIEAEAGRPIPKLFAEEGEAGFRRREAEALRQTAARADVVVALGGGALVGDANRAWAKAHGVVVYLRVPPEALARRLHDTAAGRPLLHDEAGRVPDPDALARRIGTLLGARRATYEDAHLSLDASAPPEVVARRVADAIRAHARAARAPTRRSKR
jgi:shikimate kinase